ncbi:MAG: hypothetical protein AAGC74_10180 [Verrucomicrobiota bacterium]
MRIIVFSKNRACQLELLLRSLTEQMADSSQLFISVLYFADTPEFTQGYATVQSLFPDVHFVEEEKNRSLNQQLLSLLQMKEMELLTYLVDDLVFINSFSLSDPPFQQFARDPDIAAISLRLNPNVTLCQPQGKSYRPPPLDSNNVWRWKPKEKILNACLDKWKLLKYFRPRGDWAHPMYVDGNVWRLGEYLDYFQDLPEVRKVTKLEPAMSALPMQSPKMVCYPKPRIVNLALNRVDSVYDYPCGEEDANDLNDRFLNGERLSYHHLKKQTFSSCHIIQKARWLEPKSE